MCIAVAGPRMQAELGISTEHWGWVLGAFVLSYGLFEIPTGIMGDRSGQRSTLTRVVLWWSVFTSLTGAASNLWMLVGTRFLFGAGEAGAYPNMAGVVARWFPVCSGPRRRASSGASRFGGALAPLTVVPIQMALGWRASFWIFGGLGIFRCVAWWRWYRDTPAQHPAVTPEELAEVRGAAAGSAHAATDWGVLLRSRQMWIILKMHGSYAGAPGLTFRGCIPTW